MDKLVELKACPFCGLVPEQPEKDAQELGKSKHLDWWISCPMYCVVMRRTTRKQVVMDWNQGVLGVSLRHGLTELPA